MRKQIVFLCKCLNGIMLKACVVESLRMTKSRYLGKTHEGLIFIMPQTFSPFFFQILT